MDHAIHETNQLESQELCCPFQRCNWTAQSHLSEKQQEDPLWSHLNCTSYNEHFSGEVTWHPPYGFMSRIEDEMNHPGISEAAQHARAEKSISSKSWH